MVLFIVSAAFVPLTTTILVDYLGIELLTSSFGILTTTRGLSTVIGPPIAGKAADNPLSVSVPPIICLLRNFQ